MLTGFLAKLGLSLSTGFELLPLLGDQSIFLLPDWTESFHQYHLYRIIASAPSYPTASTIIPFDNMGHTVMVLAPLKQGVTHEEFKIRYERHMIMVADLAGNAAPLSHTRFYPKLDSTTGKPVLLAGDADDSCYAAVVLMEFDDEAASQRFFAALSTESANEKIMADEAGFWEREGMKVMVVEKHGG
jgi:hypothetical protein